MAQPRQKIGEIKEIVVELMLGCGLRLALGMSRYSPSRALTRSHRDRDLTLVYQQHLT